MLITKVVNTYPMCTFLTVFGPSFVGKRISTEYCRWYAMEPIQFQPNTAGGMITELMLTATEERGYVLSVQSWTCKNKLYGVGLKAFAPNAQKTKGIRSRRSRKQDRITRRRRRRRRWSRRTRPLINYTHASKHY
jgi:hypothetical protein